MKTAVVVFAHGSAVESANEAVRRVAEEVARAGGHELVEAAFLGPGEPSLDELVPRLVSGGATRVIVVPYFLTLGTHLQRDLPRIIRRIAARFPAISIEMTEPLDGHPALREAVLDRIHSALAPARPPPGRP